MVVTDPSESRELMSAAEDDRGHLKFLGLAFSAIWKQALVLIPVIAWNTVIMKLFDQLYPGDPKSKYSKLWAGALYATVVTVVVIAIFYFHFRAKAKRDERRHSKAAQPGVGVALPLPGLSVLKARFLPGTGTRGVFVFVRASVVGHSPAPAWFMIDSGNSMCVLDIDYASRIGVRATGSATFEAGAVTQVSTAKVGGFDISGLKLGAQQVLLIDDKTIVRAIKGGQSILAEGYGGVLGMPLLSAFNLLIDYARQTVHATTEDITAAHGGVPVPITVTGGDTTGGYAAVRVNGQQTQPRNWLIDLGADRSTISHAAAQQLGLSGGPPFGFEKLATKVVRVGTAQGTVLSIGDQQAGQTPLGLQVPDGEIAGIAGHGGDLASDYFATLSAATGAPIGFAFRHKRLLLPQ